MEIKKAAVIGAGVMGSGIAAHIANAGVPVVLLDIVPEGANDRSKLAKDAIARMLKTDPAPFMHKRTAKLVTPGNLEDDIGLLADADWILEAVVENPQVKQALYEKLEQIRKPGSVVSSNTSTIPLAKLVEGLPERFRQDFIITHFFNPPRYLRLLEIVAGPESRAEAVDAVHRFSDTGLGKGVVRCKDTPGFIANRIGTMWIQIAVNEALDGGLTVEEADAIASRPMGVPKTGIFGLLDLVGIDLIPHVSKSLRDNVPEDDAFRPVYRISDRVKTMIADGYTGRKGKGGFYRLNKEGGKRVKEAIDLATGAYRPVQTPQLASLQAAKAGLRTLVEHPDKGGHYAWKILAHTLSYSAALVPGIADDIHAVDEAMRLGYAWKWGPFELIDKLGPAWFAERLAADGLPVPELLKQVGDGTFYRVEGGRLQCFGSDGAYHDIVRPEGVLLLEDVKRASERVAGNAAASLWDIGDGVACLEFHTKMNAIDPDVLAMIGQAVATVQKGDRFRALVLYNEGSNFSVGANIGLALFAANIAMWPAIENMVQAGQQTYKMLKYASFPVVGAPSGMALGGGCEVLMHCAAVQAHAETYTGLVEVGVGVVPSWGGCKELLTRWAQMEKGPKGPMPPVAKAFETISMAKVAKSAAEAREMGFLREGDGITMNRDRLLADAKAKALAMVEGYAPPEPVELTLPGSSGKTAMNLAVDGFARQGLATPHDVVVAGALAEVLSGDDTDITATVTEDRILELERAAFMRLARTPATLARIEYMLDTGKPLRN
ncbi:MAG: 3-hydroxyacyl-CoA dehydrogenase NAD-binding domain-containing protein [Alphaproteobacteria bacterium]|nr:3-hydroxyacyl-CoA dehydrogenase NAD-binding domain-containing protein [Alphaproteobacteria bacterium]